MISHVTQADDEARVCFPEAGVGFHFEDFQKAGRVAVMSVHTLAEDGTLNGRLSSGDVTLDSLRSREEHAKRLDSQFDLVREDWRKLVEAACVEAKHAWRRGEPLTRLDVSKPSAPLGFTIDELLIQNKVNIWYGAGGIGKGYLLTLAAVCVTHGRPFLGRPVQQGRVAYLDWEDEDDDMRRRIREVSAGLGVDPTPIYYRRQRRPLRHLIVGIVEQLVTERITLLIVDSCTGAGGEMDGEHGYEQIAQQALGAAARAAAVGCTVLLNDHTSGAGRAGKELAGRPYGSVRKYDLARAAWEIKREEAEPGGPTRLGMYHVKHNHTAKFPAKGVQFTVAAGARTVFTTFDPRESVTLSAGTSKLARMEYEMRRGAITLGEVATLLDEPPRSTYARLKRGEEKGKYQCQTAARMTEDARWALQSHTPETV